MMRLLLGAASLLAIGAPAMAQTTTGAMTPATATVVTPVAPPTTAVAQVAPDTFVVTPVPGLAMATKVKIQKFSDYDLNNDGTYSPMEFAQALYFLATNDPVAGSPTLPAWDRYVDKGSAGRLPPQVAVNLLNATADEFATVDLNNDWRITPAELTAVAML